MLTERPPHCSLFTTASRQYLPGVATLLSSFQQRSGLGCVLSLLWHDSIPDTLLVPAQVQLLRCAAHPLQLHLLRADDSRVELYLAYAAAHHASPSSLLKLELLLGSAAAAAAPAAAATSIWMDSDFLVLSDMRHVLMSGAPPSGTSSQWMLHGSGEKSNSSRSINCGLLVMQGGPPAEARRAVNETLSMRRPVIRSWCRVLVAGELRGVRQCGDQVLLRLSLARWIRVHLDCMPYGAGSNAAVPPSPTCFHGCGQAPTLP